MSSRLKNLSSYTQTNVMGFSNKTFTVLISEWNEIITQKLLEDTLKTQEIFNVKEHYVIIEIVSSSFKLVLAIQCFVQTHSLDSVIYIGRVIKNEVNYFDIILGIGIQKLPSWE